MIPVQFLGYPCDAWLSVRFLKLRLLGYHPSFDFVHELLIGDWSLSSSRLQKDCDFVEMWPKCSGRSPMDAVALLRAGVGFRGWLGRFLSLLLPPPFGFGCPPSLAAREGPLYHPAKVRNAE